MTTKKSIDYAEPYRKLTGHGVADYQLPHDEANIEVDCPADDLTVRGGVACWGGGLCAMRVADTDTYSTLKTRLVKLRYSLDDQMAVVLNGDPEELARMQAWRDWAADIAGRIAKLI